nr:leukocyte-associated immunoglobulin-like receptor 2 [Marmota flaviventris]
MAPCSIVLLALGLCLGQEIHAQEGALPRPSISAEPGSVIPRGRPVTIVCRGPAGVQDFRLVKEGSSQIWDKKNSSPSEREARFLFPSMSEDTAGRYHCLYLKSTWSELSEDLSLVLSREDVTQAPTPVPGQPSGWSPGPGPCPSCHPVHSLLPPPDPRPLPLHSVPSAFMP